MIERHDSLVVVTFVRVLMPLVQLFALYVLAYGHYGPGGGFQAGVIVAASVVFYAVIYGLPEARRVVPDRLVETMIALGVLITVAGVMLKVFYLFASRAREEG